MNENEEFLDEDQKRFLRKYWKMTIVFAAIIAAVVIAAITVFLWFVAYAQSTGFVPATIGLWTIGYVISFILHTIFWELVLVVSWFIVIAAVVYLKWWMNLPAEDRERKPKRGRREEGDAFSFFAGLIWLIIVWFDNRWDLPFQSWTFNDWVYSFGAAFLWMFLIIGVPAAMYFIWWLRKMKEESEASTETVDEVVDEP